MQLAVIKRVSMQFNEYNYLLQCDTLRLLYEYPGLYYNVAYNVALSNLTYLDNKLNEFSTE